MKPVLHKHEPSECWNARFLPMQVQEEEPEETGVTQHANKIYMFETVTYLKHIICLKKSTECDLSHLLIRSNLLLRWRSCHRGSRPSEQEGGWRCQLDMGDSHPLSEHEWGYQRSQRGRVLVGWTPWDRHTQEGKGYSCSGLYLLN